jgi:hypothetical protein
MEHATEIPFGTNALNGLHPSPDHEPVLDLSIDPPPVPAPPFSAANLRRGLSLLENVLVLKVISSALQALLQATQETREEKPESNESQQGHPKLDPAGAE